MNICSRDRELLCINFKFLIFMVIPVLLVVASLVVLYFGADFLVKGSSSLAVRFGISPLVVGLTVVAFGTSAPELLVSVQSALESNPGIAVGNVMGSNIQCLRYSWCFGYDLPVASESPVDSCGCARDAGGHVAVRGDIS